MRDIRLRHRGGRPLRRRGLSARLGVVLSLRRWILLGLPALCWCSTDTFGGDSGGPDVTADITTPDASQPDSIVGSEAGGGDATGFDAMPPTPCPFDGGVVDPCPGCTRTCCVGLATSNCASVCATGTTWSCFRPSDCAQTNVDGGITLLRCCLGNPTFDSTPGCPHDLVGTTGTACQPTCTDRRVCTRDGECEGGTCEAFSYGTTVTVGLCSGG